MTNKCEIIERPAQLTLGIHTHSPVQDLGELLPKTYQTVMEYLAQIGQHPTGDPFAAYYNSDMQNLELDAGYLCTSKLPGKGNIQPGSIPGGKVASIVHVGPYPTMGDGYKALNDWMAEKGYQSAGVYYEVYLNNPADTPPEALQTQIFTPLKTS